MADEDSTVNYEQNEVPHSAEQVDRQVHYREYERPSRQRKKNFSRYGDSVDNPQYRGSYDEQYGSNSARGDQDNRYNSLVLARRVKNENSRMLQSLETRFSILQ